MPLRISFDLDDTLICYQPNVPCEPPLSWFRRLLIHDEPLRRGTRALVQTLLARGWEIWVYTTSYRPPGAIRRWLRWHGVPVVRAINQEVHDAHLRRGRDDYPPSKNPRAFGIDLHVDDSQGVLLEGQRYGFSVVVVSPEDLDWTDKVLQAAGALEPRRRY